MGASIPMKATFFITYTMVDGWAGVAGEILRLKPLIIYHLRNFFLVMTEKDREEAMDPGTLGFNTGEPQIQLYFLLGLVCSMVTPNLLPFILVFFSLAYIVYRHQIINVYNQEYESAAAFWPDVHGRIIAAFFFGNLPLVSAFVAFAIAQLLKIFTTRLNEKWWDSIRLLDSGRMPSSHAATVTALAMGIGLQEGTERSEFAIAIVSACVLLNQIVCEFPSDHPLASVRPLRELLGHTPVQVVAGAALGFIVAYLMRNTD